MWPDREQQDSPRHTKESDHRSAEEKKDLGTGSQPLATLAEEADGRNWSRKTCQRWGFLHKMPDFTFSVCFDGVIPGE